MRDYYGAARDQRKTGSELTAKSLRALACSLRKGDRIVYRDKEGLKSEGRFERAFPFLILLTNGATLTHWEYYALNGGNWNDA